MNSTDSTVTNINCESSHAKCHNVMAITGTHAPDLSSSLLDSMGLSDNSRLVFAINPYDRIYLTWILSNFQGATSFSEFVCGRLCFTFERLHEYHVFAPKVLAFENYHIIKQEDIESEHPVYAHYKLRRGTDCPYLFCGMYSERALRIINDTYACDFELFGYDKKTTSSEETIPHDFMFLPMFNDIDDAITKYVNDGKFREASITILRSPIPMRYPALLASCLIKSGDVVDGVEQLKMWIKRVVSDRQRDELLEIMLTVCLACELNPIETYEYLNQIVNPKFETGCLQRFMRLMFAFTELNALKIIENVDEYFDKRNDSLSRVTSPLSGAYKIPMAAPVATPAKNAMKVLDELLIKFNE